MAAPKARCRLLRRPCWEKALDYLLESGDKAAAAYANEDVAAWDEALAVIGRVAVGLRDAELRATFVNSAEVEAVRDAARQARPVPPEPSPFP